MIRSVIMDKADNTIKKEDNKENEPAVQQIYPRIPDEKDIQTHRDAMGELPLVIENIRRYIQEDPTMTEETLWQILASLDTIRSRRLLEVNFNKDAGYIAFNYLMRRIQQKNANIPEREEDTRN